MKLTQNHQLTAKNVLEQEANAIFNVATLLDENFDKVVEVILSSQGKVVLTGIGKSAIVAQKIVATFNSTGTPAIFLHAADAIHGDLGIVQEGDVVICISKSGESPEIKVLVPLLKSFGITLVALAGSKLSFLGQAADFFISIYVEKEADPLNLAPTTSTTVTLAIGDALAICLLKARDFSRENFAKFHPGGSLGKQLYLKVEDIYPANQLPIVEKNASLPTVLQEMSEKRLGCTLVEDNGLLLGIITDGDIRRMLNNSKNLETIRAEEICNKNPLIVPIGTYAVEALRIMKQKSISQLIVSDENGASTGIIHIHDLIREGLD